MTKPYSLAHDPLFYITVAVFALLTTGLPVGIGQPNFLPLVQTAALFIFLVILMRQRLVKQALFLMALWTVLQFTTVVTLTWLLGERVERAFHSGFQLRMAYAEWLYNNASRPDSFIAHPLARVLELAGVTLGAVVSGGLLGVWTLVRAVNLAAFSVGAILLAFGNSLSAFVTGVPLWSLVTLAGYLITVVLLSEPLLTSNWNPLYYWRERKRLLLLALGLIVLGLLLEIFLPTPWRTLFR
ncbi:MAG: hypothetical protein R3C14_44280 [Caldilineaceae bacterium]